ncbi:hybrid sensor histidine kinase/response regulator [Massilia sp. S19_KUP03_FR1]|uniref:hybrid sensor histidine kinase/response regulator n=1 Tax=Massilia sp. S19_KUP03_FR1 TaxID=3025503 RepID=UPI002FCDB460
MTVPLISATEVVERAPCGLLAAGPDGLIVRINATMCGWLGMPPEDLLGKKYLPELFTVGARVFYQTHCLPMLQVQGSVAEIQVDVPHRDGTRIPMLMNIVRQHIDGHCHDEVAFFITKERRSYERELVQARKTAEAALEARRDAESKLLELNAALSQADRRKDEFLATLAHELRNPLAPIRNVIELLKLQLPANEQATRPLAVLERQVGHLRHLVDDLLDISRITLGQVALRKARVLLAETMQAAADDTRPLAAKAGHRLHLVLPDPGVTLDADPTRLMQVILNLLNNAVKYTPPGGDIWLTASFDDGQAVITVRDTGIGMPQQSLSTIFHMFSQLTPALERSQGGLGIGLALVRGLVELHGGSISAASDGVGLGSRFEVRLPAHASAALVLAPATALAVAAAQRRILVVDDNVDVTETMTMLLETVGHHTACAHNGADALSLAAAYRPHIVILDIGLPDQNGYEVARKLRQREEGATVFLVAATGWGQDADRERARLAGFDLHMTKPIDFGKLQEAIAALP